MKFNRELLTKIPMSDGARLFLALLSLVFSSLNLVSDFASLGALSPVFMLSLTITKVAVFDTLNIAVLLFHSDQKREKLKKLKKTSAVIHPMDKRKKEPPFWRSSRTRESWVEIVDDTLGALPAVFAVVAFNASRTGEQFFIKDTTIITLLGGLGFVVRLIRIANEVFFIVHRRINHKLQVVPMVVCGLCVLASLLGLIHLIVFDLLVQNVLTPVNSIWFLPAMHIPILRKVKREENKQNPSVRSYMYGE